MGRKLVLKGTTLTGNGPRLAEIDGILPEAGALLLLDPTHPYAQWGEFDLNSAGSVALPNIAFAQAQALLPLADPATLGATYLKGSAFLNDGVQTRVERTGKGGLHIIASQANQVASANNKIAVSGGASLISYVHANKSHAFYAAFWGRLTRSHKYSSGGASHSTGGTQNQPFDFFTRSGTVGETQYPADSKRIGHFGEGVTQTAGKSDLPIFQDVAASNTTQAYTVLEVFKIVLADAAQQNNFGSMAFYGSYLEDLTVSGRSYNEVHDLVYAKYGAQVKTPGGRYYGDTFTDPVTIP